MLVSTMWLSIKSKQRTFVPKTFCDMLTIAITDVFMTTWAIQLRKLISCFVPVYFCVVIPISSVYFPFGAALIQCVHNFKTFILNDARNHGENYKNEYWIQWLRYYFIDFEARPLECIGYFEKYLLSRLRFFHGNTHATRTARAYNSMRAGRRRPEMQDTSDTTVSFQSLIKILIFFRVR